MRNDCGCVERGDFVSWVRVGGSVLMMMMMRLSFFGGLAKKWEKIGDEFGGREGTDPAEWVPGI